MNRQKAIEMGFATGMTNKLSIQFQNAKFAYGKQEIFQNLSFTVREARFVGFWVRMELVKVLS